VDMYEKCRISSSIIQPGKEEITPTYI